MKKSIFALLVLSVVSLGDDGKCVQIFYDRLPEASPTYNHGRAQAMLLENLIGHFPHIQQIIAPVESYQKDQLSRCAANFYLGSYYDNPVPEAFLQDVVTTPSAVVWMGYNFWQLGSENLKNLWQVQFAGLSSLDWKNLDKKGQPGFYRFFEYRGQTFEKFGAYSTPPEQGFNAAFEIAILKELRRTSRSNVRVWAEHSSLPNSRVPYVLNSGNKWLVGEIPFSFISEGDRYLVFADLLFDMLGEAPRYPGKKPAFVRLEDVHAKVQNWQLKGFLEMAKRHQMKFGVSLIPIFADPLMALTKNPEEKLLRLNAPQSAPLVQFLKEAQNFGASIIMHGATHQYSNVKNPFNGASGADYEFWDYRLGSGVEEDSPEWVVSRLEDGLLSMKQVGLQPPSIWVTPHYQASTLDYLLFGQLFSFSAGRYEYRLMKKVGGQALPEAFRMDRVGAEGNGQRLKYLGSTEIEIEEPVSSNGQFLPYEIYGDAFGAGVIPENIGFVQPIDGHMGEKVANVKDLISNVKRNSVLRDVWASFFLHPYLLDTKANGGIAPTPGDTKDLEELIRAVKDSGYEFIDLKTWVPNHRALRRKPTIEVEFLEKNNLNRF